MNIVFYTSPGLLDAAFSLVSHISRNSKLHLILEISPEGRGGPHSVPHISLPSGLLPVEAFPNWPASRIRERLRNLESFKLAVFNTRCSFHPMTAVNCWRVGRFINGIKPNMLHFHGISKRSMGLLYLLHNIPFCISIHDSISHHGEKNCMYDMMQCLYARKATGLIFHSDYCLKTFRFTSSLRQTTQTTTIPLGIYDVFREKHVQESNNVNSQGCYDVLFFGRISPYKGVEILLEAARLVAQQMPRFRMVIAGKPISGYKIPKPPRLSNEGYCEYRLHLIEDVEMQSLFARSKLLVAPYIDATQSGVISTAYAFHKPVVATAVGGIPEMVENGITGLLVPPRNPQALASAILELLTNKSLLKKMSEAIQYKEDTELAWTRLSDMTLRFYEKVIYNHNS